MSYSKIQCQSGRCNVQLKRQKKKKTAKRGKDNAQKPQEIFPKLKDMNPLNKNTHQISTQDWGGGTHISRYNLINL